MSTAATPSASTATPTVAAAPHKHDPFDPEQYRMTIGEHLEELRRRFIFGLLGLVFVAVFCFIFGDRMVSYFCQPLVESLDQIDVNPQVYMTGAGDAFMVYMQICLICAAAISAPWMLYQLWLFVAAGLYPHERKYITKYVPLSIVLLVGGMVFVYFLVLPWTLSFFLKFAAGIPLYPGGERSSPKIELVQPLPKIPLLEGDPAKADDGSLWYNNKTRRFMMMMKQQPRVVPFGPSNLIAPHITLPEYINLVVGMLVVFALAFQLPLVVLALLRIGILELETARSARKYVYFAMVVVAAVITPGDVITATIALMIPLCLLYELGIFLYVLGNKPTSKPAT
jgi:sec-independent protein translocase protein TatC